MRVLAHLLSFALVWALGFVAGYYNAMSAQITQRKPARHVEARVLELWEHYPPARVPADIRRYAEKLEKR